MSPEHMKYALPTIAYYFVTGPWRSLWVKLGYDPRTDTAAKIYQLVDFRVRQSEYLLAVMGIAETLEKITLYVVYISVHCIYQEYQSSAEIQVRFV